MAGLTGRKLIASRCAKFFKDGDFVNLGIGVPLMCVNYLPEGVDLWLEAEIGTVGSGPTPSWDKVDIDVIDAGGQPASVIKGGSVYDHEMSFAFIRGGHIDAAVLVNDKPAKASVQVKTGDTIEIQFGSKNVKVEVLDVKETVKKEDVESMYKYL